MGSTVIRASSRSSPGTGPKPATSSPCRASPSPTTSSRCSTPPCSTRVSPTSRSRRTTSAFVIGELWRLRTRRRASSRTRIDRRRLGLYGLSLGSLTVWSTVTRTGFADSGVDALIQSDGGFPGDLGLLSGVTFPVFIAHSDVDPIFPDRRHPAGVRGAAARQVSPPAPRRCPRGGRREHADAGRPRLPGGDDDVLGPLPRREGSRSSFPETIAIDGVTTFVDAG